MIIDKEKEQLLNYKISNDLSGNFSLEVNL